MRILVTGAGGFIGGWVAEAFHLQGIQVRAGIRRWSTAARIARFPLEIVRCDVLDPGEVADAVRGCDGVVHCSFGSREVTVRGTEIVLDESLKAGVKRVVHLSTIDVYGKTQGVLTETTPVQVTGSDYGDSKIEAEAICNSFGERGLEVVILRPTVVYGPYCKLWIAKFAERLRSGRWAQFDQSGDGICNPIYITDLIQAIELALRSPNAPGQTFNVNGADVVTWNEYFRRLNDRLGFEPLRTISTTGSKGRARLTNPLRGAARFALKHFNRQLTWMYQNSLAARSILKAGENLLKNTPSPEELAHFGNHRRVDIQKARTTIGYEPRVSLDEGLRLSVEWLRHETYGLNL